MNYDCLIVGGGIAGLQAAIQLGRYDHQVALIDAGYGRSTLCRSYHNLLGYPDGISGDELRRLGREQAQKLGVHLLKDKIVRAEKNGSAFRLFGEQGVAYDGKKLLMATGVLDRFPDLPGLVTCLGISIYVCPDCDGYEIKNRKTLVLGAGQAGANMALMLTYWTSAITYINHEKSKISSEKKEALAQRGIGYIEEEIERIRTKEEGQCTGVLLKNGEELAADRAFISFGGNQVQSDLAHQLGVERLENKHIITNPRTKETNIPNVWSAGDVNVHSEQVSIAMGEGSQAAIWIHKRLLSDYQSSIKEKK